MSDYIVRVRQSRKRLAQRYFVTIQAGNGEPLFTSEMLKHPTYALELGQKFAGLLEGNLVNELPE